MLKKIKGALIKAVNSIDITSDGNQLTDKENSSNESSTKRKNKSQNDPNLKYRYTRPHFLQLFSEDEILVSADQMIRPIIVPRDISEMPWNSGYAEAVNTGKTIQNEDQASIYKGILRVEISQQEIDKKIAYMMPIEALRLARDNKIKVDSTTDQNEIEECKKSDGQEKTVFENISSETISENNLNVNSSNKLEELENKEKKISLPLDSISIKTSKDSDFIAEDLISPSTPLPISSLESSSSTNFSLPQINESPTVSQFSPVIEESLPYVYFGIFDGHAGPDVAVAASKRLHKIIDEKLHSIADFLIAFGADKKTKKTKLIETEKENDEKTESKQLNTQTCDTSYHFSNQISNRKVSIDSLIIGVLESAFWKMDEEIENDKMYFHMLGGCTALVALFILGKMYVANAGDSRAIFYKDGNVIPMSFDFTPESERERIRYLGSLRPEFLGHDFTQLDFVRRPMRQDLGKQLLYQDALMSGWAYKTITLDDLKLPLICGNGKRSRVAITIGVTRGFGDHELRFRSNGIYLKPFLTPHPQVRMINLEEDESLTDSDVLIMGTDGLWDVTPNSKAAEIVQKSLEHFPANDTQRFKYRYISAAQDLVMHSRGKLKKENIWQTCDGERCNDDVSAFVIPVKAYRQEYLKWKEARNLVRSQT